MAEALKHLIGPEVVRWLAARLAAAHRPLDRPRFEREGLAGLASRELLARGTFLAELMHRHLPAAFPDAVRVLVASLEPEDVESELSVFRYHPHTAFVARYGLDHFEPAMRAQYELTKRFTAEFSIRPFLERHPAATLARLRAWTSDPSAHVRRLVSEGTRPRLPWAPRLPAFQADPSPVLALLDRLVDDPERYVQRSVANNLNDISKDHPALAIAHARGWLAEPTPARVWIARHALRSLVKRGDRAALALFGVAERPRVSIGKVELAPRRVARGGELRFSVELVSTAARSQDLLVDYAVHFVKADGSLRPKVFKLRRVELAPRAQVTVASSVSFADLTTRKHYPGRHALELRINGVALPVGEFDVR